VTQLSIIIVNYNTQSLLRDCLQSLDAEPGLDAEIIIVDNASTDDSAAMVRQEFPVARVIANTTNRGFAQANNQGIAVASGEKILLLNPDTRVLPGALAALVRFVDAHARAGAVGPRLLNNDLTLQPSCHDFPNLPGHFLDISELYRFVRVVERWRPGGAHDRACQIDWVTGACLLLRREAIRQVGVLDPDYFMYAEEMDWCYRAKKIGWLTYFTPEAEVIHLGGGSASARIGTSIVQLYHSLYLFYRKHRSTLALLALRVLVFVLTLPKVILLVLMQDGTAHRRDLLSAYWQVLWLR
jgi:GT2 family glycosyltransferase